MDTTSLEPIIARHPFVAGMEQRHIDFIVGCARNVKFHAGERIFREGQSADTFYLLRSGDVRLLTFRVRMGEMVVQTLHDDDILGWSWLIPPFISRNDAEAITLVRAIAFDGACMRRKMEEDHDLGYSLTLRMLACLYDQFQMKRLQSLDIFGPMSKG
jgi:CRP-like cAMP-binding protein